MKYLFLCAALWLAAHTTASAQTNPRAHSTNGQVWAGSNSL